MANSARRPQPDSATGLGRRGQGRWSQQAQPTPTHSSLSWIYKHCTTILFTVGWLVLCYVVVSAYTTDQARSGTWGCELPRMIPIYRRLEPPIQGTRYDTYLYREGGWDPETPVGSPVIFLPGHAGDYKQARSVAASVARQYYGDVHSSNYEQPMWAVPVDVWAVHYNEDFTAIHAPTLLDQANYLVAVVPRILKEYNHLPEDRRPKSVTLLGHSMGGVVARLAIRLASDLPVDVIVTIATPHQLPPANLEFGMERLYAKLNTPSQGMDPLLVSICGGTADTQIVSDACALSPSLVSPKDGFAVFSSGIPAAWTNVEHQAIVWCEQIRWRVARVLLDMKAASTREGKLSAAKKWLKGTMTLNPLTGPSSGVIKVFPVVNANMSLIVRPHRPTPSDIANPPFSLAICINSSECQQLSSTVRVIPFPDNRDLPFPLPGEGIRNSESAFVIDAFDLPSEGSLRLESDLEFQVYSVGSHLQVQAPVGIWTHIPTKIDTPAHLSMHFPSALMSSMLAWRLDLSSESCVGRPPVLQFQSHAQPTDDINEESRFYVGISHSITLHSHISGAPFQGNSQWSRGLDLEIYQQPDCEIDRVHLKLDVLATIAKATLRLRVAAITWTVAWAVLIVYRQLMKYHYSGDLPTVASIVEADLALGFMVVSIAVAMLMGVQFLVPSLAPNMLIGCTHWYFVPLALGLMVLSLGSTIVVGGLLSLSVCAGRRFLSDSRKLPSGDGTPALQTRAAFACVLLLLVKLAIPVGIAYIALFVILFVSVCRSAAGELVSTYGQDRVFSDNPRLSRYNLLSAGLLLMTLMLPFHVLGLAVWGRNVWAEIGHPFDEDHAVLPLIPVLLFVEQSTRGTLLLSKDTIVIRAAMVTLLAVAGIALALGPRRPFLLQPASSIAFLALSGVLGGFTRSRQA